MTGNLLGAEDGLIRNTWTWDPGPDIPPDDDWINGRPAAEWERERITEAKLAQRAECAALLDGVIREGR